MKIDRANCPWYHCAQFHSIDLWVNYTKTLSTITEGLLDLPGIIEGAKDGKGRGRQVISTARTCNCILIVLDAIKPITHKRLIEKELEGFGISHKIFLILFEFQLPVVNMYIEVSANASTGPIGVKA
ncbi:hypothetical protein CsSME_00002806 [Camellia sinensis var. sinensis]